MGLVSGFGLPGFGGRAVTPGPSSAIVTPNVFQMGEQAMTRRQAIRSAVAFFLVTFATAFLATVGARLTGWFSRPPDISSLHLQNLGLIIMVAVITLAVGAAVRRLDAAELRSALLGAASVLLAIPLSAVALIPQWPLQWTIITVLGGTLLAVGFLVSVGMRDRTGDAGVHD